MALGTVGGGPVRANGDGTAWRLSGVRRAKLRGSHQSARRCTELAKGAFELRGKQVDGVALLVGERAGIEPAAQPEKLVDGGSVVVELAAQLSVRGERLVSDRQGPRREGTRTADRLQPVDDACMCRCHRAGGVRGSKLGFLHETHATEHDDEHRPGHRLSKRIRVGRDQPNSADADQPGCCSAGEVGEAAHSDTTLSRALADVESRPLELEGKPPVRNRHVGYGADRVPFVEAPARMTFERRGGERGARTPGEPNAKGARRAVTPTVSDWGQKAGDKDPRASDTACQAQRHSAARSTDRCVHGQHRPLRVRVSTMHRG